ncbi:MAG: hypothetical protein ABJD53_18600 [Gammaproteobacteria bacterium]
MNKATKIVSLLVLCCAAGVALAQQATAPARPANAQSDAGEPRADTSSPSAASGPASSAVPSAAAPAPAGAAAVAPATAGAPVAAHAAVPARAAAPAATAAKTPAKTDRLELGTATVTGDREQPKVMYIVPWKRSDIGDLAGKPMNSLVDEILSPVDRDVFKREVVYYRAVQADASQNGAAPKPAPQGEK